MTMEEGGGGGGGGGGAKLISFPNPFSRVWERHCNFA